MTSPDLSPPLTEKELDRLETLLGSKAFNDEAMPLDALQGFFLAIASGPDLILPSRWLPAALGSSHPFDDEEHANETLELVMRYYNQAVAELGQDSIRLLLYASDKGVDDFATWCTGYLQGVDLAEVSWFDRGDPEEIDDMLYPFLVLAGELPAKERRSFRAAEWRALVKSCQDGLADAVFDIRDYWRMVRKPPSTVRRATPKTGRNDLCPCGSGKKFKQCCGSPAKLH